MRKIVAAVTALVLAFSPVTPAFAATATPNYQTGTTAYFSILSNAWIDDSYYYTDSWFSGDPAESNAQLALASGRLATAATDAEHGVAFLEGMGFEAAAFGYSDAGGSNNAFVFGAKRVVLGGKEQTLVAVAPQGAEYELKGWLQNVSVNDAAEYPSGNHASFDSAAELALQVIAEAGLEGDLVFWLAGQSRGGAVANLLAAKLVASGLSYPSISKVFAYTFESPATSSDENVHGEQFACIHNYVSSDDVVTMLPPWGMGRYGQDHALDTGAAADLGAVASELKPMNEKASEYVLSYDAGKFGGDVKAYAQELVANLVVTVPTRASYSALNTDRFTQNGTVHEISYTYQRGLMAFMEAILGGEKRPNTTRPFVRLLPLTLDLPDLTYSYLEERYAEAQQPANAAELTNDAVRLRWELAGKLYEKLADGSESPLYSREDLYAFLKLLCPLFINDAAVTAAGAVLPANDDDFDFGMYFDTSQLFSLALGGYKTLLASHQPDTIIARLKLLAPDPIKKAGWYKDTDGDWHFGVKTASSAIADAKGWKRVGTSDWYYFDTDTGKMYRSKWLHWKRTGAWYYFGNNGKMLKNAGVKLNDHWYWFKGNGVAAINETVNGSYTYDSHGWWTAYEAQKR